MKALFEAQQSRNLEEVRSLFAGLCTDHSVNSGAVGSPPPSYHHQTSSSNLPTRLGRLDFPRFDGEGLLEWVFKCDQFFEVDNTPADLKVKVASVHLEGRALYWHQAYMKARLTRECPTWEAYCQALHNRFGSLLFDDPMSALKNLRQRTSVQAYLDEFDLLLHRVDIAEEHAISFCLAGLKDEIEYAVRMFQPKTLLDVFSLARLQEHRDAASNKRLGNVTPGFQPRREHFSTSSFRVPAPPAPSPQGPSPVLPAELGDRPREAVG
ncbi:hypothetical protein KSP39_PZI008721 [Platanthera zijinensis]|uniref:Retrotransposon gag domain-containing protein n=1 Tax=Platanthera zijinensis TaxID=2320716 RepID=A0AAP0BL31_9ASPA